MPSFRINKGQKLLEKSISDGLIFEIANSTKIRGYIIENAKIFIENFKKEDFNSFDDKYINFIKGLNLTNIQKTKLLENDGFKETLDYCLRVYKGFSRPKTRSILGGEVATEVISQLKVAGARSNYLDKVFEVFQQELFTKPDGKELTIKYLDTAIFGTRGALDKIISGSESAFNSLLEVFSKRIVNYKYCADENKAKAMVGRIKPLLQNIRDSIKKDLSEKKGEGGSLTK